MLSTAPEYKFVLVDREDVMFSHYMYDNGKYESVKFEFQFGVEEITRSDSSVNKQRRVKVQNIYAELSAMTKIYNHIFGTAHTPDKIMAVSRYEKPVGYHGTVYNSILVADDYKPGYWILRFYKL